MDVMNSETTSSTGGASGISMIKKEFRKGFEIPILPHQKYGMLSRVLWPSKNQIIRIVPGHDERTGEIFPQNINVNSYSEEANPEDYLSNTFTKATVVSRFGTLTSPFISDYEPGSDDWRKYAGETVIHRFIRKIMNACRSKNGTYDGLKATPEWIQWCGIGPQARLSFDKPSLLMQALVFMLNGRYNQDVETGADMLDEDGDPVPVMAVIAVDNKLTMLNLYQALVSPMNPSLPLNPTTNNKYGALAELEGNKLYLNTYVDATSHHAALRPSLQAAGKGWTPEPFQISDQAAIQLWQPWRKLLNFMTAAEQVELCAKEFGADTVNYVIGQDQYLAGIEIPDYIKGAGLGRYAGGGSRVSLSGSTVQQGSQPPPFSMPGAGIGKGAAASAAAPKLGTLAAAQSKSGLSINRSGLSGIQPNSTMDTQAILARTEEIRRAAGMTTSQPVDQAADAESLLDDNA